MPPITAPTGPPMAAPRAAPPSAPTAAEASPEAPGVAGSDAPHLVHWYFPSGLPGGTSQGVAHCGHFTTMDDSPSMTLPKSTMGL